MQNCKEVSRVIAADEIEDAGLGKRLTVWLHLVMCKHCRRYAAQIRDIGRLLRKINTDKAGHPGR